jgi:UDP-GlcNAc:undecaprenyl-phosphate GlcNAc-1-phosphate transferase
MPNELLVAGAALIASLGLTPAASRLAQHYGAVDRPGPRKIHRVPMPLWGGVAMLIGLCVAVGLFPGALDTAARAQMVGILAAATLLVVIGSLDDHGLLHHQIKLFIGMPLAGVILLAVDVRAHLFVPLFGSAGVWVLADIVLTMFWVVGVTAAFSILDHMDGLCAGIAAIATAFFLALTASGGQVLVGTLGAATLGAAVGFLRWNFNPARIFMGDGGAMFLGFMMATLGLKLRPDAASAAVSALIPVLILGVPLLDTTLVTISRTRRGLLPFTSPGKDHVSHRLANLGLGRRRAVLVLYSAAVISGAFALLVRYSSVTVVYVAAAAAAIGALAVIAWLERCPFERQRQPHD